MNPSRPASTSTRQGASPLPAARPVHQVNTQTKILDTAHGRILCIADIRGKLSGLNDLAREANAKAIIHTGDFGFFESSSLERINDRTLRHLTMYSPLIPSAQRTHLLAPSNAPASIRATVSISLLSEFPLLLSGQIKLTVPVYTVWGACEDVAVIQRFRSGAYAIDNLHLLDEATTRCIDVGGVQLRLLGLGGALVPHKLFDNGDGEATIAGGQGTMWTTALQIGELVDTAQRVFDPAETRLLVTHASPGREGLLAQLALVLKADLTVSAGLHFRYATSYNEFSVQGDFEGFRHKLMAGKEVFDKVWESVRPEVDVIVDENQRVMLDKVLHVAERVGSAEEPAWKNCWNWNLCDAAYGSLVLDIKEGRVSSELKSQGFNYAYRRSSTISPTPNSANTSLPPTAPKVNLNASYPPTKAPTPAPAATTNGTSSPAPVQSAAAQAAATTQQTDKAEREKQKKKDKKERKDRERAERDAAAKEGAPSATTTTDTNANTNTNANTSTNQQQQSSKKNTPSTTGVSSPVTANNGSNTTAESADAVKSPVDGGAGSGGSRTPKKGGGWQRNPWTLWMRMQVTASEGEVREFFGEAAGGIVKVNFPANSFQGRNQRMCYVEFGDEDAMKAGLEQHAEKLNNAIPEVKIATDREQRTNTTANTTNTGGDHHPNSSTGERGGGHYRGGGRGGRGGPRGGGGYAARGFAMAGLTRGGGPGASGAGAQANAT